jgi:spermidine synthase
LEREAPQNFDVLAVDAFSGDSIPVHMLSREAVQLYFQHLQPRGILAIHISNQVLNLAPVVERIAASLGKHAVAIESDSDRVLHRSACTWALLANHPEDLSAAEIQKAASELESNPRLRVWTDDYSNLFQIIE